MTINILKSEDKIHQEIYLWFHNNFPEKRGLLCYNLNNSKNKIDGNLNRGKGLQAGRSDLVYYRKGKAYMIELKDHKGSQSPDQVKWQRVMEHNGFEYHLIRSLDEFKNLLISLEGRGF